MQRVAIIGLGGRDRRRRRIRSPRPSRLSVLEPHAGQSRAARRQGRQDRGDPARGRCRARTSSLRRWWRTTTPRALLARRGDGPDKKRPCRRLNPARSLPLDPRAWPRGAGQGLGLPRRPGRRQPPAAESGGLRFFVGASLGPTRRRALPSRRWRTRWICSGQSRGCDWKLINNQLAATQIAALAEALADAAKAGFTKEQISDLILGGAPASPIVKLKLPRMLAEDFEPADFAVHLMLKDARYATALAKSLGAPAGMISGAAKAFARAEAKGLGDKDIAAVAADRGIERYAREWRKPTARRTGERPRHGARKDLQDLRKLPRSALISYQKKHAQPHGPRPRQAGQRLAYPTLAAFAPRRFWKWMSEYWRFQIGSAIRSRPMTARMETMGFMRCAATRRDPHRARRRLGNRHHEAAQIAALIEPGGLTIRSISATSTTSETRRRSREFSRRPQPALSVRGRPGRGGRRSRLRSIATVRCMRVAFGYFDHLLPKLGVRGSPGGQRASYFCLENDHWRVVALDTAYNSVRAPLIERFIEPDCALPASSSTGCATQSSRSPPIPAEYVILAVAPMSRASTIAIPRPRGNWRNSFPAPSFGCGGTSTGWRFIARRQWRAASRRTDAASAMAACRSTCRQGAVA